MTLSKRSKMKLIVVITASMLALTILLVDVNVPSLGALFVVFVVPLIVAINRMPDDATPATVTAPGKRKNGDQRALFDRLVADLDGQERAYLRRRLHDTPDQRQYDG